MAATCPAYQTYRFYHLRFTRDIRDRYGTIATHLCSHSRASLAPLFVFGFVRDTCESESLFALDASTALSAVLFAAFVA